MDKIVLDPLDYFIEQADMSIHEREMLVKDAFHQYIPSDFHFLNEHKGWRPGKVHLIIAPTHAGKSTLTRSLIWDFLNNTSDRMIDNKAALWLSEESREDFKTEFAKLGLHNNMNKRISIASEQEAMLSLDDKKKLFRRFIEKVDPNILFFDNVTTSCFYPQGRLDAQEKFAEYVKAIAKQREIPIVIIAHTGGESQLSKRLLELNDIRGAKTIVNLAEFAYILQTIKVYDEVNQKTEKYPIIRLEKHRGQDVNNILFQLKYNPVTMSFQQDRPKDWNEFKELFKKQMAL